MDKTEVAPELDGLITRLVVAVREIAAERPEVFLPIGKKGCHYNASSVCSDDSEGCLIGQGMKKIGWPWGQDFDHGDYITELLDSRNNRLLNLRLDSYITDDDVRASGWLYRVQMLQDEGISWRSCVTEADTKYGLKMGQDYPELALAI